MHTNNGLKKKACLGFGRTNEVVPSSGQPWDLWHPGRMCRVSADFEYIVEETGDILTTQYALVWPALAAEVGTFR